MLRILVYDDTVPYNKRESLAVSELKMTKIPSEGIPESIRIEAKLNDFFKWPLYLGFTQIGDTRVYK